MQSNARIYDERKISQASLVIKWNFLGTCTNDSSQYFIYYGFPAVAVRHSFKIESVYIPFMEL